MKAYFKQRTARAVTNSDANWIVVSAPSFAFLNRFFSLNFGTPLAMVPPIKYVQIDNKVYGATRQFQLQNGFLKFRKSIKNIRLFVKVRTNFTKSLKAINLI